MEKIYDNAVDVKTLSSRSPTIQEGPRRFPPASVLGLGLLSVFLLAGLIGLAVHYHNSVGVRDQLINQLKVSLTEKTREVECLKKTCPEGWWKLNCSCYLLSTEQATWEHIYTEKASWEQSRQDCRARGADLVIVDSKEEQEFITSMIKEATWIGLSYREEEGTWKWVDESPLTLTFWDETQPDYGEGDRKIGEEDCVNINPSAWWKDRSCEDLLPWICEKEA